MVELLAATAELRAAISSRVMTSVDHVACLETEGLANPAGPDRANGLLQQAEHGHGHTPDSMPVTQVSSDHNGR